MTGRREPFDGNDYRKRVLAAVHRRGGPDTSDPFELYDLPLEGIEDWNDTDVATQVDEVWGFWQRQRDHPKYGTLVTLLVEGHAARSAEILDAYERLTLAAAIRSARDARDVERYELLDQAIRRLVERHRGVPREKVDGLVEIGALSGLSADEVRARLRRHRVVDAVPAAAPPSHAPTSVVSDHRRQQVRDLLDEFGRLQEQPPPPTLLALLGLAPYADDDEISFRASGWRARCRELPPTRIRAVADELMVHVADLLESGPLVRDAYLDAVVEDVRTTLRPRVRAAVLVEDRLVADDQQHLFEQAQDLGLDPARARQLLASLAAEMGVDVDPIRGGDGQSRAEPTPAPADRVWENTLREARAALRRGALIEARRLAATARVTGDPAASTPVRAVADEIDDAIREAELRWRAATSALGSRRFAEAVEHLEQLCRTAHDVASPSGGGCAEAELERARAEIIAADAQVAAAAVATDQVAALLTALERWPAHPAALEALALLPLHPPVGVRVLRDRAGAVVVEWQPSATPGVTYRITRIHPDGTGRVIGRTGATRVEDGGAPPGPGVPDYAVVALQPGRSSDEARCGSPQSPSALAMPVPTSRQAGHPPIDPRSVETLSVEAPGGVVAERKSDGAVVIRWTGPSQAEFKIARQAPDGRWQVVGRTRHQQIEDGGAAATGPLPVYAVTARCGGAVSDEARTEGASTD